MGTLKPGDLGLEIMRKVKEAAEAEPSILFIRSFNKSINRLRFYTIL